MINVNAPFAGRGLLRVRRQGGCFCRAGGRPHRLREEGLRQRFALGPGADYDGCSRPARGMEDGLRIWRLTAGAQARRCATRRRDQRGQRVAVPRKIRAPAVAARGESRLGPAIDFGEVARHACLQDYLTVTVGRCRGCGRASKLLVSYRPLARSRSPSKKRQKKLRFRQFRAITCSSSFEQSCAAAALRTTKRIPVRHKCTTLQARAHSTAEHTSDRQRCGRSSY